MDELLPPPEPDETPAPQPSRFGRRAMIGALGVGAVGVVIGGRALLQGQQPAPASDASAPVGVDDGYTYFTVVDHVDEIPASQYVLRVTPRPGAEPVSVPYAELAGLKQTTLTKDVQCVTGWRVPRQVWTGVLLRDLLAHVDADRGAAALTFGSFDGRYTESLTMEQAMRPDVMVALTLDGVPVSAEHGGPARLYVAPMYFYKSLKWLGSVSVASAVEPGYWEKLGYDVDAWVGQSNGRTDAPIV